MAPNQPQLMVAVDSRDKPVMYVNYADANDRMRIYNGICAVHRHAQGGALDITTLDPEVQAALTDSQGRSVVPRMADFAGCVEYQLHSAHCLI